MDLKDSWKNPYNANYAAAISDASNRRLHQPLNLDNELDEFSVINILMAELVGTFKFETKDDFLLENENLIWWTLMFYGRVGIWEYEAGEYVVVKVSRVQTQYNKIVSAAVSPTRITFMQKANSEMNPSRVVEVKDMDKLVIVDNGVAAQYFLIKYGWFIQNFLDIHAKYLAGLSMRVKNLAIFYNTTNTKIVDDLEASFNDNKPFIKFDNPMLQGKIKDSPQKAMEEHFTLEQLKFGDDSFISLTDVIRYWKYGKDLLGMNENAGDQKSRTVAVEVETAIKNTVQIEESQMRNWRLFCKQIKEKFGMVAEVKKTTDEIERDNPNKSGKQAFKNGGEEESDGSLSEV